MKKRILALLQAVVMLTAVSACGISKSEPEAVPAPEIVNMATGDKTGSYHAFGNLLAGYMSNASGKNVQAVSTAGSIANITSVDDGTNLLGIAQSDIMAYAWNGECSFKENGPLQNFRTLGGLYEEAVQIVTLDENIKTVADLEGKMVSIGAPDSGVYHNAIAILDAYGLTENDIEAGYLTFSESVEAMKDGKIDAAFMVSGSPTKAVAELAEEEQVYLVSIEGEEADALLERCPYYNKYTIFGNTYAGVNTDVHTISVQATMIVSADASEKDVYKLTKGIYNNIESISAILTRGIDMSVENGTTGISVPFHPGAAKYFAEQGFTVPTE